MSKLRKGTLLTAIDECIMDDGQGNALIVGCEYAIISIDEDEFIVTSRVGRHHFDIDESSKYYYGLYFKK